MCQKRNQDVRCAKEDWLESCLLVKFDKKNPNIRMGS